MAKILGNSIPNMPWEDRPEGCRTVDGVLDHAAKLKRAVFYLHPNKNTGGAGGFAYILGLSALVILVFHITYAVYALLGRTPRT